MKITFVSDVPNSGLEAGQSCYDDDYPRSLISALHQGKRPLCVQLPGNIYFCVYSKQITDGIAHEPGWTVSGEPDNLTLTPSVNFKDVWHGFITGGSFSPDEAQGAAATPRAIHPG